MDEALSTLLKVLDVEELEKNYFRGHSPETPWGRIFGGQVLGQALMAAGRTVAEDRRVHSLQAYFLLAGDPTIPIMFEVDRIRDGRSFTTRRVRAFQRGEAIFALSASFHVDEDGPEHEDPMPPAPDPDSPEADRPSPFRGPRGWAMPFDVRWLGRPESGPPSGQLLWLRLTDRLPDDPLLHACLLAFVSDLGLVSSIAQPHVDGEPWIGKFMMASLDHAMWFHRPFRVDEWLLYERHSPAARGARGVVWGGIYSRDGARVSSVAQEGLVRPVSG